MRRDDLQAQPRGDRFYKGRGIDNLKEQTPIRLPFLWMPALFCCLGGVS